MGGKARNHGGTRGHGCSPKPGERPNFNIHTLSDINLLKIVKISKKSSMTDPADQKIIVMKELPKISNERYLKKKTLNFHVKLKETGTEQADQNYKDT